MDEMPRNKRLIARAALVLVALVATLFYALGILPVFAYAEAWALHVGCGAGLIWLWWLAVSMTHRFSLRPLLALVVIAGVICAGYARTHVAESALRRELEVRGFQRLGVPPDLWWQVDHWDRRPALSDIVGCDCVAARSGDGAARTRLQRIVQDRAPGWGRASLVLLELHGENLVGTGMLDAAKPAYQRCSTPFATLLGPSALESVKACWRLEERYTKQALATRERLPGAAQR